MNKQSLNKVVGFTLIELISVIVILGILAVGLSSFLRFGTQIYAETTAREQIISSARFAVERLNRELRQALPNTVRTYNNAAGFPCLQFTPIIASSSYIDLPVLPEPSSSSLAIIPFKDEDFSQATKAIVYPLDIGDLADSSDKNHVFSGLVKSAVPWVLNFSSAIHFDSDSPSQRIYFINSTVDYCLEGTNLRRYGTSKALNDGVIMAQDIASGSSFQVTPPSLQRNALIKIYLQFEKNFEKISFNNEVQVSNVP